MPIGVLTKGFTIHTVDNRDITIPKSTIVFFDTSRREIRFKGFRHVKMVQRDGKWFAEIFGELFAIVYDAKKPPYPISYFKH